MQQRAGPKNTVQTVVSPQRAHAENLARGTGSPLRSRHGNWFLHLGRPKAQFLTRNGVDLVFETDLLYLDVTNPR